MRAEPVGTLGPHCSRRRSGDQSKGRDAGSYLAVGQRLSKLLPDLEVVSSEDDRGVSGAQGAGGWEGGDQGGQ